MSPAYWLLAVIYAVAMTFYAMAVVVVVTVWLVIVTGFIVYALVACAVTNIARLADYDGPPRHVLTLDPMPRVLAEIPALPSMSRRRR